MLDIAARRSRILTTIGVGMLFNLVNVRIQNGLGHAKVCCFYGVRFRAAFEELSQRILFLVEFKKNNNYA